MNPDEAHRLAVHSSLHALRNLLSLLPEADHTRIMVQYIIYAIEAQQRQIDAIHARLAQCEDPIDDILKRLARSETP